MVYVKIASSYKLPRIGAPPGQATSFEIVDMFGKVMLSEDLNAGKRNYKINVSELPAGVYMLRVVGLDVGIVRKLVVVR